MLKIKIQSYIARLVPELRGLSYEERMNYLNITSVEMKKELLRHDLNMKDSKRY